MAQFLLAKQAIEMADPVVELQSGTIRGLLEKHDEGFNYYAFKGIPYAEPRVGKLRFKDPLPKKKWTGVLDCKKYGPICLQYNFFSKFSSIEEDCLYLNVFTCAINNPNEKKPVIVIIHGGAYYFQSGDDLYYGPEYLIRKNIVLVTFDYRLGVLGFLNLEDKIAPGNQGFKDQVLVLQWIQKNIQSFSGDPNIVTIYGTYTAGTAAHILTLSPLTKGLIYKAISESSCQYCPFITVTNPKSNAKKLCAMLGKELESSEEILDFLMSVDAKSLQEAQERLRMSMDSLIFGPAIDSSSKNPFMPVDREIAANEAVHIPYLIGYDNRQGSLLLLDGFTPMSIEEQFKLYARDFKNIFNYNTNLVKERFNLNDNQVRRLYYNSEKVSVDNNDNYVDFCSDFYFIESVHRFARTQSERSSASTYMYVFEYDSPISPIKQAINRKLKEGATLGTDTIHLFKMRMFDEMGLEHWKKGTQNYRIMEQLTEMWANFATYGRPTIETNELIPVHWKPITDGTLLRYLSIDEDVTMKYCVNVDQKLTSAKDIKV